MATINQRTLADGRTRYWVKWRLGGTRGGPPQSEPFDTRADAHTFKLHVEDAGHHWPENWIPRQGWAAGWIPGHGWIKVKEEEEPAAEPVVFADFARELIDSMTGIEERTRADYHRELELHLIPHFGQVDLRDVTQLKPKDVRAWINQLRTGLPDPKASYRTPNPSRGRRKEPGWLRKPLSAKFIHNLHGLLPSALRCFLAQPYLVNSTKPIGRTGFSTLVDQLCSVLPLLGDAFLDEGHLRSLDRKISAALDPKESQQELRAYHPGAPAHLITWVTRHYPRPFLQQSRLCRALTDTAIDYEDPPEQAEEALRWLEAWSRGNAKGPVPHPVRWILTGQRSGPRASQLLEILPRHLLTVRLGAAHQALSRSSAARRRSRVRSLPSSSSDSKRGRPTVRPVTATRTGA